MKPLCLLLVLVGTMWSQEVKHAPTVAQCQADQRLWLAKLEDKGGPRVTVTEMDQWFAEMMDCEDVDPGNKLKYYNTASEAVTVEEVRLTQFLIRHGLWAQFNKEDAEGSTSKGNHGRRRS